MYENFCTNNNFGFKQLNFLATGGSESHGLMHGTAVIQQNGVGTGAYGYFKHEVFHCKLQQTFFRYLHAKIRA